MVTQGTNDSGSNMNRGRNGNGNGPRNNNGYGARNPRTENKGPRSEFRNDRQGEGRGEKPRFQKTSDGGNFQKKFDRNEGNGYNKSERYDRNKNYNSVPRFPNKDEDEEDNGRRSKPSRPKENKPSVAIPDKNKVQLRLEKEQKSMKKKQQSKKKESARPQPRVKRSNNVNYTKNYANGDYDDYEDYDEYYDM